MRREDRSSISTYPPADLGWKRLIGVTSSLAPHIAQFLCSSPIGRSFVPAPQNVRSRRAQGAGGQGRAVARVLSGGGLRRLPGRALTAPEARREDQAGRMPASSVLVSSKARPFASTAQAMRASLLASAIASTLWCNRLLAASIQDLSP